MQLGGDVVRQGLARGEGLHQKDGTYVEPHRATNPDNTKVNNYSAKGNVNPYTGKEGTKHPLAPTKKK